MTITNGRQALLFNEIQLIIYGLHPFNFIEVYFHDNPQIGDFNFSRKNKLHSIY